MATYALREAVNLTSNIIDPEVDELAAAGFDGSAVRQRLVLLGLRNRRSAWSASTRLLSLSPGSTPHDQLIRLLCRPGVVGAHINEEFIKQPPVDVLKD